MYMTNAKNLCLGPNATYIPLALIGGKANFMFGVGGKANFSVPKQHSIWAPNGSQLGQVGPILECCLGFLETNMLTSIANANFCLG